MSRVHLVTYATPRFRLRQLLLGLSARESGAADTVTGWTPDRLAEAGFAERMPEISLKERGSGFWAWKPFVIARKLAEVPDGDVVLYCDVGRVYPWKLIDRDLAPIISWMGANKQEVFPGIEIPWHGPLGHWTKRDAFVHTETDRGEFHQATTIQASFSIWRKTQATLDLAKEWLEMCGRRELVSDDASTCGLPELPGFAEHRHDQSLWSILCKREGMKTLSIGTIQPDFDEKNPARIATFLDGKAPSGGSFLRRIASMGAGVEKLLR
jgi:hypothetical protein